MPLSQVLALGEGRMQQGDSKGLGEPRETQRCPASVFCPGHSPPWSISVSTPVEKESEILRILHTPPPIEVGDKYHMKMTCRPSES